MREGKPMRAYEVFLNGKRLCVAGTGKGYISAYITHTTEQTATWINLVARRPRRSSNRGLSPAGRSAAQNGHLRHAAF